MKITAKTEITVEATVTVYAYSWCGNGTRLADHYVTVAEPFKLTVKGTLSSIHQVAAEQASRLVFGHLFRFCHETRLVADFCVEALGLTAFTRHIEKGAHHVEVLGFGADRAELRATKGIFACHQTLHIFRNPAVCKLLAKDELTLDEVRKLERRAVSK